MPKVKLTVTESRCRISRCKPGDEFIIHDQCPPICNRLWSSVYPFVSALQNGEQPDSSGMFDAACPHGRVCIHGEIIDD